MLKNYRDHAANERTYLAWVRTAITFMTLGLVIEKFQHFLNQGSNATETMLFDIAGIAMFLLSLLMLLLATWQYYLVKRNIDREASVSVSTRYINLTLTVLVLLIGVSLLVGSQFSWPL